MKYFERNISQYLVVIFFVCIFPAQSSLAEQVALKLKTGDLIFRGDLVGFDGKTFVMRTSQFGQLSVDTKKFTCVSENCATLLQALMIRSRKGKPADKNKTYYINFAKAGTSSFNIHGSNTIGTRLMPALIKAFGLRNGFTVEEIKTDSDKKVRFVLKDHEGKVLSNINLERFGSSTAFPALENSSALIGMSDRRISTEEVEKLAKAGIAGMRTAHREHVIGVDGILIIVSPKNTISTLSKKQLAQIFSGEITDWSQVGAPAGKIRVFAPDNKSGTYSTFRSLILKPNKLKLVDNAQRYASNSRLSDKVANDANAIGITGFAYKGKSKAISIASKCGIVNAPTHFNVNTDEYPLSRRLYLYTAKSIKNKYAKYLLEFSKDANSTEKTLKRHGFIGRAITMQPYHEQGQRMAAIFNAPSEDFDMKLMRKFSSEMRHANRLSFTVRFRRNSSKFDSESAQLFGNLGRFIVRNRMENNYFILAGFSDSSGPFANNLKLSKERAQRVYGSFLKATQGFIKPERVIVKGYGELLPVACNDTDKGKARNRRVEVWTIRPEHWKELSPPVAEITPSTNQLTQKFPSLAVEKQPRKRKQSFNISR